MNASNRGYLDGLTDARNGHTPVHSQSRYQFPHHADIQGQRDYNNGYYEAKAKYAEASQLNNEWLAKNQCARCAGLYGFHGLDCPELKAMVRP